MRRIFKYVPGLTVENFTDTLKGGEAHRLCLAGFEYGQVCLGYADFLRQLAGGYLPLRHHYIKIDYYWHILFLLTPSGRFLL